MRVQNPAMRDVELSTSKGLFKGDFRGVFEVPDEVGNFLISTPGWTTVPDAVPAADEEKSKRAKAAAKEAAERKAAEEKLAAEEAERQAQREAAEKAAREAPTVRADEEEAARLAAEGRALEVSKPEAEAAEEGPDLEALDKDGLLAVAEEYGVKVDARWSDKKLREALDKALYGEGE